MSGECDVNETYKGFWVAEQFYSPTLINESICHCYHINVSSWDQSPDLLHEVGPSSAPHQHTLPSEEMNSASGFSHSQFHHTLILTPADSHLPSFMRYASHFFIMDFLLATCVNSLIILFQDNHFLLALKGCFCSKEYSFFPSGTLHSVMLIYIYIAPFTPEDPNALYKLSLFVHRSWTNRQAT